MRRVFLHSNRCGKRPNRGGKLTNPSRIMMALVLLMPSMPLRAQSSRNLFSGFQEFNPTANVLDSHDPARGLGFRLDSGPLSTAGNAINQAGDAPARPLRLDSSINFEKICAGSAVCGARIGSEQPVSIPEAQPAVQAMNTDTPGADSKASSALITQYHERPDRNLDIYYRNRTEFSLDVGWHPINVPFIFDFAVGDSYNRPPLNYTVVPIVASLRWHVTNVGWKWIFRGNTDFTFSGSITAIPRGPESHYYAFNFGIRRNFVYRNWKVVPYWEQRGGAGIIDAKEPLGILFAQGQNLTFTYNMGAGVRYNIDSKYSFSAGLNYMHISNAYLSQPAFYNYGINVYGPMFGLNVRLGKPHHDDSK